MNTANDKIKSGDKFRTKNGISAIKDGIKADRHQQKKTEKKPNWLRVKIPTGDKYQRVKHTVDSHNLSTVCEESHCPNLGECWSHGTATIMLMGSICTRACKFCSVDTGNPRGRLDPNEPKNAAKSVKLMKLRYVVLTSVDRDDLKDGGAAHYAACVEAIKSSSPDVKVEALTPDFSGSKASIRTIATSGLDVFAQNLETVKRLTTKVRDPRAGYHQTLDVLAFAKKINDQVITKSSLMLGLGETENEIVESMLDLRKNNVELLTLGQYLRPTPNHLPVSDWISPEKFQEYRGIGLEIGFSEVAAGPLVRSSYRADRIFENNNLGLDNIPLKRVD